MINFLKEAVFRFYLTVGIVLNIFQLAVLFGLSDNIRFILLNIVAVGIGFSFWLTSSLALCYIIAKFVDRRRSK